MAYRRLMYKPSVPKYGSSAVTEQKSWHCMETPVVSGLLPRWSASGVQMHLPQLSMASSPI